MAIYVLGDIHFSSTSEWKLNVGKNIVKYFTKEFSPQVNNLEDECILLGDLFDQLTSPGSTYALMNDLYTGFLSCFRKVYIIPGNHDYGIFKSSQKEELTFSFLASKHNVEIIDDPYAVKIIQGKSCLFLPHIPNVGNIEKYYDKYYQENCSEIIARIRGNTQDPNLKTADYAFGHITIESPNLHYRMIHLPKDKIPANRCIFGHIHTSQDEEYLQSIYACKINEVADRHILKITEHGEEKIKIPEFCRYSHVTYPDKIAQAEVGPYTTCVYEVEGNISESVAKEHYASEYVLRVISPLYAMKKENSKNFDNQVIKTEDFIITDFYQTYKEMIVENNIAVSTNVDQLIQGLFTKVEQPKKRRVLA